MREHNNNDKNKPRQRKNGRNFVNTCISTFFLVQHQISITHFILRCTEFCFPSDFIGDDNSFFRWLKAFMASQMTFNTSSSLSPQRTAPLCLSSRHVSSSPSDNLRDGKRRPQAVHGGAQERQDHHRAGPGLRGCPETHTGGGHARKHRRGPRGRCEGSRGVC